MSLISRTNHIRNAIVLMGSIFVIGVIGYMLIEKVSFLDSLYMTVITISTVGYGEVATLHKVGKIFTIFLILTSWVSFAYALSVITTHFVEGELSNIFTTFRSKSGIQKMEDHIILIGYGRNGHQSAVELKAVNQRFVIIEKNHDVILRNQHEEHTFIEGDATEDETLIKAGIRKAKAVITSLPVDADNLFIALSARSLNPTVRIISRAMDKNSARKLLMVGIDNVVMPEMVGGEHMAALVVKPDVVEFLDHISAGGIDATNLEEIICSNLPDDLKNHSIYELGIRQKTGANIIGFKSPDGHFIINPTPDTLMIPNSKIFVLGTPEQIGEMKSMLNFTD